MKTGLKIISGAGSLFVAAPSSYGIYHVWDANNPTGDKRLLSSGYTFSQPKLTSQEHPSTNCSENLFQEKKQVNQQKLYGCAVMKIEKSTDEKFIKFNSEVALRKGNNGWIINTVVENHKKIAQRSGGSVYKLQFGYIFTKKEIGTNKTSQSWFFWDGSFSAASSTLKLAVPQKEDKVWYESTKFIRDQDVEDVQIFESPKELSAAWISDETNGREPWIFENIEMWGNEKDYSEVFCKKTSEGKCADYVAAGSSSSYEINDPYSQNWLDNFSSGNSKTGSGGTTISPTSTDIRSKIKEMINAIKDIQGDWMDLNEVCGWRWNRNLDDSHLDKLKMYCSK